MRRLFIVGAKLLGLQCLWWAIFTTLQIMSYSNTLFVFERPYDSYRVIRVLLYGVGLLAYFVLAIYFASILLLRTYWLAEKVGFDKDSELPGWPEEHKLLSLGIVLLGFYVLVTAIPGFAKSSLTLLGNFLDNKSPGYKTTATFFLLWVIPVLRDVLSVTVGFFLILMPSRIIQWLQKAQKSLDHKLTRPEENVEKDE